jgi:hypothetical protein
MLLPMMGLLLVLIVVGALASLVAIADPKHARLAPYFGFVSLSCGLGSLVGSVVLAYLVQRTSSSSRGSALGFFLGYFAGGLAGAAYGLYRAVIRQTAANINWTGRKQD